MIGKLGWLAAGGFGVGIIALSLVAVLGAQELSGWNLGWLLSSMRSCHDDDRQGPVDPTVSERHWPWEGGDTVDIDVPATVHYRGGSGDELSVRGSPQAIAALRVHNGRITKSCRGGWARRDLDITLPGRAFRKIGLAGSGRLVLENVDQPQLDLALAGSGSVLAQGGSDRVKLSIAGAGSAKLASLKIKRLDIHLAGRGDIEAAPQDEVNVDIAGAGEVRLLSDPPQVHTNIMGSGRVIRAADR